MEETEARLQKTIAEKQTLKPLLLNHADPQREAPTEGHHCRPDIPYQKCFP